MSQPTPDARAVVRALDALSAQVRRIADAVTTPVVEDVRAVDDDEVTTPTTPADTCGDSIRGAVSGLMGPCVLRAGHAGPVHREALAGTWTYEEQQAPADEDALRATRRDSLRNLLARLERTQLHGDEIDLLRRHVEAEIRESDQWRAGRNTMKRRGEEIERDRDRLTAELEDAEQRATGFLDDLKREQAASAGLAQKIREQRGFLARVRGELAEAQAAIERVRALASRWAVLRTHGGAATELRAALDGTEQPTTDRATCMATIAREDDPNNPSRCIAPADH